MLGLNYHRITSLLVTAAVFLGSLPCLEFGHRHEPSESSHGHQHSGTSRHTGHHHHGGHHHSHDVATSNGMSVMFHRHLSWWGFEMLLPEAPNQQEEDRNVDYFSSNSSVRESAIVQAHDFSVCESQCSSSSGCLNLPTASPSTPMPRICLPGRLCDAARQVRSGVLLV